MYRILFIILLSFSISQDCDDDMLMFDCTGLGFCNNEATYGYDCYVNNEYCDDFNNDGITDSWVGDGWCDDGEWGYDFQCSDYSFDCGDCGDPYDDTYGYCSHISNQFTFLHNDIEREYLLYIPEGIGPSAPLVLVMHGYSGTAQGINSYSGMNQIADEHGFAVCYPNGLIDQSGNRFWNVGYDFHQNQTIDDVGFLTSLAMYLQDEYDLSHENTFAAGMSNGAEMSYKLACEAGNYFKAIAPVAGTMFGESWSSCNTEPIPVLEIHGTDDSVTLWDGDLDDTYWGPYPGVEDVIDFWVSNNECASNENTLLPGVGTIHHRYFDCSNSTEVWLYEVIGGGHDWPSYSSHEIWNFFSHFMGTPGDVNQDGLVNIQDIILLVSLILDTGYSSQADINTDGQLDITDIVQLINLVLG